MIKDVSTARLKLKWLLSVMMISIDPHLHRKPAVPYWITLATLLGWLLEPTCSASDHILIKNGGHVNRWSVSSCFTNWVSLVRTECTCVASTCRISLLSRMVTWVWWRSKLASRESKNVFELFQILSKRCNKTTCQGPASQQCFNQRCAELVIQLVRRSHDWRVNQLSQVLGFD